MHVRPVLNLDDINLPDDINLAKKHRPSDDRSDRIKCYLCMSRIAHREFIYELESEMVQKKRWYVHKTCWERYKELRFENGSSPINEVMSNFKVDSSSNLNVLQDYIHQVAIEKGWWSQPRTQLEIHALIHSEVSEATEAVREGKIDKSVIDGKPEGEFIELADVIIRILDYAEASKVSMIDMIIEKMSYNENRPYRHGGKKY